MAKYHSIEERFANVPAEDLLSSKALRKGEKEFAELLGISVKEMHRRERRQDARMNQLVQDFVADKWKYSKRADVLRKLAESSPIYKLIVYTISDAVKSKATEIKLRLIKDNVRVSCVVGNEKHELISPPHQLYEPIVSALKAKAKDYGSEHQGFDFKYGRRTYKIDVIPQPSRSGIEGLVLKIK